MKVKPTGDTAHVDGPVASVAERRPLLPAVVGPWAAYVISRDFGDALTAKARQLAKVQPEVSAQLDAAVRQLREAGRQALEARSGVSGNGAQAGGGTAEVPQSGAGARSGRPPSTGLTTRQVAARLRLSERQVRNLRFDGLLVATWKGRALVFDEVSVALEIERRRSAGDDRRPGAA